MTKWLSVSRGASAMSSAPWPGPVQRATTVPTGTVSPAATRISASVPSACATISLATLSVSTTNSESPALTSAPLVTLHSISMPSVMVRPSLGMSRSFNWLMAYCPVKRAAR